MQDLPWKSQNLRVCYVVSSLQIRVENGDSISFTCTVSNDEEVNKFETIIWYRHGRALYVGGQAIRSDDRYDLHTEEGDEESKYILTIRHLTLNDEGEYACEEGTREDKVYLYVSSM